MGQHQSKDQVLYQFVQQRDITAIREVHRKGAGLEWIDRDGKTPLIVACINPELLNVAKVLIELGANLNYYRPGRHGGTPLHHAAKRGLQSTIELLLVHGANPLIINDDCQTPLEVARTKGCGSVVRAIENHICLFSGWLREFHGPTFLELLAPQFVSRKVWVVVVPCGGRNPSKPFKLELAIYSNFQDAEPRLIIALWKAHLEESNFHRHDPFVTITDNSSKTRAKLAPASENDRHILQLLSNACRGIPQQQVDNKNMVGGLVPSAPESDMEMEMAITASIHDVVGVGEGAAFGNTSVEVMEKAGPSQQHVDAAPETKANEESTIPSAPPAMLVDDPRPITYPSIDVSAVDVSAAGAAAAAAASAGEGRGKGGDGGITTCVVCLDSGVEGVCVPCGHMAGCMSCLNAIKTKDWGCPVCRSHIQQVVRLFAV